LSIFNRFPVQAAEVVLIEDHLQRFDEWRLDPWGAPSRRWPARKTVARTTAPTHEIADDAEDSGLIIGATAAAISRGVTIAMLGTNRGPVVQSAK
jgi:hypothetical protein